MSEVLSIHGEEKKLIQRAYRQLLKTIDSKMEGDDAVNLRHAYELAVEAHSKQRRKSGEPYILHPIEVARICSEEIGLGPTAVICALLHDVVEDTPVTLVQIKEMFGERVAKIVDGLTKLDGSYDSGSPQAENFKKVLSTLVEDVRVVLIKMADRLHNMRTLGAMPRHKQLKIAAETTYIYSPLAHRLGLYAIKTEFQDLCMKITDQEPYFEIANKLQATKTDRTKYINEFIHPLTVRLDRLNVPYRVFGRPKSIYSIWNKIKNKNVPFEEIFDLFAVRIVINTERSNEKSACWQIYSEITDVYLPIPERLKDWVTTPKSNGYESLHTTVIGPKGRFVEVQIRSERMDEIAERGFAAHWKYKDSGNDNDVYQVWLDNIRDILENPISDALEFLSDFKTNLFNEEIYVYTPNGDLKILPKGATALDFAFSIHSDVGSKASAIKVSNRLVPMGYKLRNGDQVTVITKKNQKPREDWLKMVVTGKARAKIRASLKEDRKIKADFGKEALQRKLKHLKADFEEGVDFLVKHFKFTKRTELYFAIHMEDIKLNEDLKEFVVDVNKLAYKEEEVKKPAESEIKETTFWSPEMNKSKLIINGEPADRYKYSFASCCNPVNGDPIFSFLTAASGLKIHRANCPNATHLMANFGYRILKAEWTNVGATNFVVDLKITGVDTGVGIIEQLTHTISSQLGVNIRSFNIKGEEGVFEGRISLVVTNTMMLNDTISALLKLDMVSTVSRSG
ncbi:MAG: RelA/SpoT family protein [Saprospiraceae bacterium]|nr:RelA/SpoT family protein [Saprospiraceae bacterium]